MATLALAWDIDDAGYVDKLRSVTWQLAAMDTQHGGDDVLAIAARAFRSAHSVLAAGAYLPGVEHDLQAAVGAAGELAAWIAYDLTSATIWP